MDRWLAIIVISTIGCCVHKTMLLGFMKVGYEMKDINNLWKREARRYQSPKMFTMIPGFSLIELMIVICIVGILASISVTTYSEHVIRSKVSQMMPVFESVKNLSEEYYAQYNTFPTAEDLNIGSSITVDPSFYGGTSKPIANMYVFGGSSGRIDVESGALSNSANPSVRLIFSRPNDFRKAVWNCQIRYGNKRYAPKNCQNCSSVDNGDGTCS